MIRPIGHFDWQVLRTLLRATAPLPGRDLRLVPSRHTKDGTFLDDLVSAGLIEPEGEPEPDQPASAWSKPVPVQFRTRYRLTARGEYAAEHGEYEDDFDARRAAAQTGGAP